MESKVKALLAIKPTFTCAGSHTRSLHTWDEMSEEESLAFENFAPINGDKIRVEPIGNMFSVPARNISDAAKFHHKTFNDALKHLNINGHLNAHDMLERIQHYPFLASAFMLANISKSRRRACAALIVRRETFRPPVIVSSGVNGTRMGSDNLCEDNLCELSCEDVVHAEVNAFKNMRIAESAKLDTMYITDSPCPDCLNFLRLNTDIRTLVFARNYRITEHMEKAHDFTLIHIPEREVVDYINASENRMSQIIC